LTGQVPKVEVPFSKAASGIFFPLPGTMAMTFFVAAAASFAAISESILSISDNVLSRLAASAEVLASAVASALAMGVILDA
jgi:hypothetical protein